MKRRLCLAMAVATVFSASAYAGNAALEQLKALEKDKQETHQSYMQSLFADNAAVAVKPVREHHYYTLPDGTQVDFNDYAFVVFMQQHCPYSAKFDPVLKALSEDTGINAYAYTLDGGGDSSFPHPMIPTKVDPREALAGEIMTFFGNGLPIATPTTFMVNVNTLKAYPVYQGQTDASELMNRARDIIMVDIGHMNVEQLGAVPTGNVTKG